MIGAIKIEMRGVLPEQVREILREFEDSLVGRGIFVSCARWCVAPELPVAPPKPEETVGETSAEKTE